MCEILGELNLSLYRTDFIIFRIHNKSRNVIPWIMVWFFCLTLRFKREVLHNSWHDQEHPILRQNFSSTNQSSSTKREQPAITEMWIVGCAAHCHERVVTEMFHYNLSTIFGLSLRNGIFGKLNLSQSAGTCRIGQSLEIYLLLSWEPQGSWSAQGQGYGVHPRAYSCVLPLIKHFQNVSGNTQPLICNSCIFVWFPGNAFWNVLKFL